MMHSNRKLGNCTKAIATFALSAFLTCALIDPCVGLQTLDDQRNLLEQFTSQGVQLADQVAVQLPKPLLLEKSPQQIEVALKKLSSRHGWERFSKNSPASPVLVELSYVNGALQDGKSGRIGHLASSYFVAYAKLESLKDEQLMASLFGSSNEDDELVGFSPEKLPDELLRKQGIMTVAADSRYSTIRIPLMNRVVVDGSARVDKIQVDKAIIIAWQLDPHFYDDKIDQAKPDVAPFLNRYVKVERNELGQVVQSPPVAYLGCGGYLCVQPTGLEENQLLIESHFAIHEPSNWFAGSNFLRSKLPPALQESAQSFRRKLGPVQ